MKLHYMSLVRVES